MWQDLKHGARMLAKNPGFTFVAIVSIAIGVGANAAMFSVADTLVLRPLTVPRAGEIVTVTARRSAHGLRSARHRRRCRIPTTWMSAIRPAASASLMAFRLIVASFADRADQPAQRKFGMAVSGNLFDIARRADRALAGRSASRRTASSGATPSWCSTTISGRSSSHRTRAWSGDGSASAAWT